MKKSLTILSLIVTFSSLSQANWYFDESRWYVTENSMTYQCPDDPGASYEETYTLCSYSYQGGKWVQNFIWKDCYGEYGPQASWGYGGYMILDYFCWDGAVLCDESNFDDPNKYEQACTARELRDNGFVLDYLNEVYPNGNLDANDQNDILDYFNTWTPPAPYDVQACENSTGSTEKADPVFMRNGEYEYQATDLAIPGRKLNIEITRTYGSRHEYRSQFGYGWDMSYNMKVRRLASIDGEPNLVILLDGKGFKREYTQDEGDPNLYTRESDLSNCLYDTSDVLTLIEKSGIEYGFDANGNLSSITDENGNNITITYNSGGLMPIYGYSKYFLTEEYGGPENKYGIIAKEYQIDKVTDDIGREIDFTYDSNGLLSTVTDFANRTWIYTYEPNTNLLFSVEDPNGNLIQYGYDSAYNLTTITDANGQTYITNQYYKPEDVVNQQTYGDANYVFVYDDANNTATITDREGFVTTMVYSSSGQVLSETIYTTDPNSDPNSFTTQHSYEPNNLELVETIFPAGNCIYYTYNDLGDVNGIYKKIGPNEPNNADDPNVIATAYTYDDTHIYDINSITDPRGNTTTFDYDANGNVTQITYPMVGSDTPIVEYTYNQYGQVETATAPDGIVTKYEYYTDANDTNNYGHVWKVTVDYNTVDGLNITTAYQYDAVGNVIEVNDPNGDITQFAYDNLDLLTQTTAPSPYNYTTNFSYNKNKKLSQTQRPIDDSNQITSYTYDILDHIVEANNPLGYKTTYGYNLNEEPNLIVDAEDNNTVSVYNERGLLIEVIDANGNSTKYTYTANGDINDINDTKGNITGYTYDGFDRLITITYPDGNSESFEYDKNSNITGKTNRKGEIIYYEYDALNRMTVKNRPGEPNINFSYDIASRVTEVNDLRSTSDGGGITTYSYDRIGRVNDVNDIESRVVGYEYDSKGLRTKLTYPDSSYITYEYDALSRLTRIKDDDGNTVAAYQYDELSRRTLLALGNDANAVYEHDLGNRLTRLTNNIDDTNSIIFDYNDYDNVGNRLSCKIDDTNAHVYTYDNLYQLTGVDYNDGNSTSYAYDALGNRTDVNDGSSASYTSNNLNQYTDVGGTSFSYDDNGNLTDDGTYLYYYDCENRLTDVNDQNDAAVASYTYDYQGRRIAKNVSGTITKFCYDGGQVIAEYDGSDNLLRKFIYGPGIDEPICMINVTDSNAVYYYHFDGLGSVVALSDTNAGMVERYSYNVFGEPNTTSTIGNPYLFTGRRHDSEAGLYYYRARYYAHDIGRFLQSDLIHYAGGLNLYTYCGNNPLNWVDPWGLCKEDDDELDIDMLNVWYNEIMRNYWGVEYGLTVGVATALKPLSWVSEIPEFTIPPIPTPWGPSPSIPVPTQLIGTAAGALDKAAGDWLESHAAVAKDLVMYHHRTMKAQQALVKKRVESQKIDFNKLKKQEGEWRSQGLPSF